MRRSKKKLSRKKALKRLTIIKVLPKNGTISQADLDRWHDIFRNNLMSAKDAVATGEVEVEYLPLAKEGEQFITVVKIGNDEHSPSIEDLEQWRKIFEDASKDPDFKIFTHRDVNIEVFDIGKIVTVE